MDLAAFCAALLGHANASPDVFARGDARTRPSAPAHSPPILAASSSQRTRRDVAAPWRDHAADASSSSVGLATRRTFAMRAVWLGVGRLCSRLPLVRRCAAPCSISSLPRRHFRVDLSSAGGPEDPDDDPWAALEEAGGGPLRQRNEEDEDVIAPSDLVQEMGPEQMRRMTVFLTASASLAMAAQFPDSMTAQGVSMALLGIAILTNFAAPISLALTSLVVLYAPLTSVIPLTKASAANQGAVVMTTLFLGTTYFLAMRQDAERGTLRPAAAISPAIATLCSLPVANWIGWLYLFTKTAEWRHLLACGIFFIPFFTGNSFSQAEVVSWSASVAALQLERIVAEGTPAAAWPALLRIRARALLGDFKDGATAFFDFVREQVGTSGEFDRLEALDRAEEEERARLQPGQRRALGSGDSDGERRGWFEGAPRRERERERERVGRPPRRGQPARPQPARMVDFQPLADDELLGGDFPAPPPAPSPSASAAPSGPTAAEVASWDAARVAEWLVAEGLPEYSAAFVQHGIDGAVLLELTPGELEGELGVRNLGDRKRILAALDDIGRRQ